jgi:dienelactone hydrolase
LFFMRRTLAALAALALLPAAAPQHEPTAWERRLEAASKSEDAWKARKAEIRRQILVSAGLWPEFERPPLKPVVFGKLERDGYSVEKVHLETLPGFHLTGNLYRPLGPKGPFPGVVSPHGHWKNGRFNDTKEGSVPGRAITLARLGFVVFTYDMVGYGDFKQLPHKFSDPAWGMGLLGLQLWNSVRAVDFVESLPDVDPKRIGATGASGGGTQTFLLTAVDDRIACAAPVNMVAGEFQGGCSCENAPFLRIDLNNVEIAAAAAPRPLLLVCCTGDWTKNVPTFEGPVIQRAYKALGVEERFRVVQFNYGHNYNQDSREAVYAWFARWLQGKPDAGKIPEPAFTVEKKEDLAVFGPDHPLPDGAVDAEGLKSILRKKANAQIESLFPQDAAALKRFRELMLPALTTTLTARPPKPAEMSMVAPPKTALVVTFKNPPELQGHPTLVLSAQHDTPEPPSGGNKEQLKGYPTTFFRTELARQVQDILDKLAKFEGLAGTTEIRLVGEGEAGIPTLLAASLATFGKLKQVIVDLHGLEDTEALWTGMRDHPAIPRVGGLRAAAVLCAPRRLVLHNTQGKLDAGQIRDAYRAAGAENALTVSEAAWNDEKIAEALK